MLGHFLVRNEIVVDLFPIVLLSLGPSVDQSSSCEVMYEIATRQHNELWGTGLQMQPSDAFDNSSQT